GTLGSGVVAVENDWPATGLNYFKIGITNATPGQMHHADLRSEQFSLGPPGDTRGPLSLSFAYKLPGKVKPGDDIEVLLRFYDPTGTNILDQKITLVGSSTADSEMRHYKTITVPNIIAPPNAFTADL